MCAAMVVPGRLFATSFHSTVPVASSVTWKTATPRAEFEIPAHTPVSLSELRTAIKVLAAGWSAATVPAIAPSVRTMVLSAMPSLRILTPPRVELTPVTYAPAHLSDQISPSHLAARRPDQPNPRYARNVPGSIRVARIFGIDINVHFSWIVIFFVVVTNLSESIYPDQFPQWSREKTFVVSAVSASLFFASVVAHELAHSLVARRFQMTVSSITLFMLGGVASLTREPPSAKAELFMAAAGPLTSIVIGVAGVVIAFAADSALATAPWLQVVSAVAGYL